MYNIIVAISPMIDINPVIAGIIFAIMAKDPNIPPSIIELKTIKSTCHQGKSQKAHMDNKPQVMYPRTPPIFNIDNITEEDPLKSFAEDWHRYAKTPIKQRKYKLYIIEWYLL